MAVARASVMARSLAPISAPTPAITAALPICSGLSRTRPFELSTKQVGRESPPMLIESRATAMAMTALAHTRRKVSTNPAPPRRRRPVGRRDRSRRLTAIDPGSFGGSPVEGFYDSGGGISPEEHPRYPREVVSGEHPTMRVFGGAHRDLGARGEEEPRFDDAAVTERDPHPCVRAHEAAGTDGDGFSSFRGQQGGAAADVATLPNDHSPRDAPLDHRRAGSSCVGVNKSLMGDLGTRGEVRAEADPRGVGDRDLAWEDVINHRRDLRNGAHGDGGALRSDAQLQPHLIEIIGGAGAGRGPYVQR